MSFVIVLPCFEDFFSPFTLVSFVCLASLMLQVSDLQIKCSIISNIKKTSH